MRNTKMDADALDSLHEWFRDYWKPFTYAVTTALILGFARRIWRLAKRTLGIEESVLEQPRAIWPAGEMARTFRIGSLRAGITVGTGTRLAVIDRGAQQFSLGPGRYGRSEIRKLLKKHDVAASGLALQYITAPVESELKLSGLSTRDAFDDVEAVLKWNIRISDQSPEKIMDWHLSREGWVEQKQVLVVVEEELRPVVQEKLWALNARDLFATSARMREDLERFVNEKTFAGHGLAGHLRSLSFHSDKFDRNIGVSKRLLQ